MKTRHLIFVTASIAILSNCTPTSQQTKPVPSLSKLNWLQGKWNNPIENGMIGETWSVISDAHYNGHGWVVIGTDTVSEERIDLLATDSGIFYIPVVNAQNNGQPVVFKGTALSDTLLVFENPTHDFPQRISYRRMGADSITAEISGMVNDTLKSEVFPLKRAR